MVQGDIDYLLVVHGPKKVGNHWVRASASSSVNLGFIPQVESYQKTLKNGIHSFPACRLAHRDSVENKPASLLVVSLGKALNGMPPSSCGRQMGAKQSTRRGGPV